MKDVLHSHTFQSENWTAKTPTYCYCKWKMFLKSHTCQSENWTAKTPTYCYCEWRMFCTATQSSQKTELPRHSHTSTILMEREKRLKDIFKVSKTQDHLGIQSQFSKNRHQNQPFSIRLPSARRMWLTISISHSVHPLPVSHMCNKTAFNKDGCLLKVGHCMCFCNAVVLNSSKWHLRVWL